MVKDLDDSVLTCPAVIFLVLILHVYWWWKWEGRVGSRVLSLCHLDASCTCEVYLHRKTSHHTQHVQKRIIFVKLLKFCFFKSISYLGIQITFKTTLFLTKKQVVVTCYFIYIKHQIIGIYVSLVFDGKESPLKSLDILLFYCPCCEVLVSATSELSI